MRIDPDDPKVGLAVLGRQVEDFLLSDIGTYLLEQAKREEAEAMDLLKRVHPWRRRRIQELQNRIAVVERVQLWLADAIYSGHAALELLKQDQD